MNSLDSPWLIQWQHTLWTHQESSSPQKAGDQLDDSDLYRPHETSVQSGIYAVLHDTEHRRRHLVIVIAGETFPECEICKQHVRYGLVRSAPYVFHDDDFSGDESDT